MTIAHPTHPTHPTTQVDVRQELALLEADHAELLAHVRAAVAAARDGQLDAIGILAGLLEERGQMPGPHQHAPELLALAWAGGERR
jgi:hypothetical protein